MEELIKQAEQGDAEVQFKLAMAYYEGNGTEENHEKAFEWWMKAAEQEVPGAMHNIGVMYRDGDGVEQDLFNAMHWFGKAHRYGVKEAKDAMISDYGLSENAGIQLQKKHPSCMPKT